ncbi:MAG: hypothetical protein GWP91_03840 [Rhodobacterales bacterium]|nr:hypothetical protein [Rhodobacterales bacterium]
MSDIFFPCDKCDQPGKNLADRKPAWAQISAWDSDCITWLNQAPDEEDPEMSVVEDLPLVGDIRCLLVRHPFRASTTEPFWTMFCPPLSLLNGWRDFPDEIAQSGLVKTEVVQVIDGGPDLAEAGCALVEVRVVESIQVDQLGQHFPEASDPGESLLFMPQFPPKGAARSVCGDLTIVDADAQAAQGGWVLLQDDAVLLFGTWDFHTRFVYAGRLRVSDEQRAAFDDLCGESDGVVDDTG